LLNKDGHRRFLNKVTVFLGLNWGMICEQLYAAYIYMANVRVNHLARMA